MSLKILGQSDPVVDTLTTIYTVPASKETVCSTLTICNRGTSAATIRVAARPAAGAISDEMYIYYDVIIPANETMASTIGISLATTDDVQVYTDVATVSFTLFGNEDDA